MGRPGRIAFDAVVETVNEAAGEQPGLIASDPYGAGWMLTARPTAQAADLLGGEAMLAAYAEWMRANDFPGCGGPPAMR